MPPPPHPTPPNPHTPSTTLEVHVMTVGARLGPNPSTNHVAGGPDGTN